MRSDRRYSRKASPNAMLRQPLIDIGVNLTHAAFRPDLDQVLRPSRGVGAPPPTRRGGEGYDGGRRCYLGGGMSSAETRKIK